MTVAVPDPVTCLSLRQTAKTEPMTPGKMLTMDGWFVDVPENVPAKPWQCYQILGWLKFKRGPRAEKYRRITGLTLLLWVEAKCCIQAGRSVEPSRWQYNAYLDPQGDRRQDRRGRCRVGACGRSPKILCTTAIAAFFVPIRAFRL